MGLRARKSPAALTPLAPLEPGAVRQEGGWFIADFRGERVGRFFKKEHAENMWRRWASSYPSGVTAPTLSFVAVPRVMTRKSEPTR